MSFVKNIFGKSGAEKRLSRFQPGNFTSSGLSGSFSRNKYGTSDLNLRRSTGLSSALSNLQSRLGEQSSEFGSLRSRVSGGVGDIVQARVRAIRDTGSRTVGNLREELGKRRIAGSAFGEREIAATEAMFGREEERARAEGALTELGLEAEFINQEFGALVQGFETMINQYNVESALAAQMSSNATNAVLSAMSAAAQIAESRRGRNADILGTIAGYTMSGSGGATSGGGKGSGGFG